MKIDPSTKNELIAAARKIRDRAYVPYSHFKVGAAILSSSGAIYTGINIENASYGLTVCAERNAIAGMIKEGDQHIKAVAVASSNGVTPCGACRQVLREFGSDFPVWIVDEGSDTVRQTDMGTLLPDSFDASQLPDE